MSFKDQMAADVVNKILDSDENAEMVRYTPFGAAERFINAIVDRRRVSPSLEDGGRTLKDDMEISISRHETLGISMVTKGQDKVVLSDVIGGPDVTFVVIDILEQDEAMWTLLLRK